MFAGNVLTNSVPTSLFDALKKSNWMLSISNDRLVVSVILPFMDDVELVRMFENLKGGKLIVCGSPPFGAFNETLAVS